jgi:hypothetical protein
MGATREHERDERCLQSFLGKSEVIISFEIAGHKWKDNINVYLKEIVWGGRRVWIHFAQNKDGRFVLMNMVEHVLLYIVLAFFKCDA